MPEVYSATAVTVRWVNCYEKLSKAEKGEPVEPGKPPKIDERIKKLLVEDLKERPFVILWERCEYMDAMSGVTVSRSTMCRATARIGSTRKKGGELLQIETNS